MTVTVTPELARRADSQGSVVLVQGLTDTGRTIVFAGDARPMYDFLTAVIDGGEPLECDVEPWQILGRG